MSAFIMDPHEIEQLGKFVDSERGRALEPRGLFVYRKNRKNYEDNYMSGQRVAEAMMRENVRSVNYRYNERTRVPKVDISNIKEVPPVELVNRLLSQWHYQACERKDFKWSEANDVHRMLTELALDVAVRELRLERARHIATTKQLWGMQKRA